MLVSVLIPTYNSAKYITATLDSVFYQTYPHIELIISDDCSSDNTFELCSTWIEEHKSRFSRTILVKTTSNAGIAGNYNNALAHIEGGEWIKCLDSDDLLKPKCIETFVKASQQRSNIDVWYSGWEQISEEGIVFRRDRNDFPIASAKKQLRSYLLYIQDIHTNTLFIRTTTLRDVGGFDMKYPMTQDIPLIYKLLVHNHTFGILPDEYTMQFRHVASSVSRSSHPIMNQNIATCRYDYSKYFLRYGLIFHWYNAFVTNFINKHHTNGPLAVAIGYCLRVIDLVHWYNNKIYYILKQKHGRPTR